LLPLPVRLRYANDAETQDGKERRMTVSIPPDAPMRG
jgi:hypothetical protein